MTTLYNQFLSFILQGQTYAFPILSVVEIIQLCEVTPMPQAEEYVLGVINLRGKIVPVIDARKKLGAKAPGTSKESCIIILETQKGQLGTLVDKVEEVLQIESSQIDEDVSLEGGCRVEYLSGMAHLEDDLVMIIDIEGLALKNTAGSFVADDDQRQAS